MTDHFRRSLQLLGVAITVLLVAYFWLKHRLTGVYLTPPRAGLPVKDKEIVTYNEKTHTLTVITKDKTVHEYAKNPVVELRHNGDVVITRHLMGFEAEPFLGVGWATDPGFFLGTNLLHFGRLNGNMSVSATKNRIGFYTGVGYNFWSNTSLNIAIDPLNIIAARPDIALFVSVRL